MIAKNDVFLQKNGNGKRDMRREKGTEKGRGTGKR
jgi:hypothetical protein